MNSTEVSIQSAVERDRTFIVEATWFIPVFAAIISIVPFVANYYYFKRLFWFGDELHLISQMDHEGFWPWVGGVFAENYVPLFKVLWGGAMFLFNGSYFAMVSLVWFTHFLNVILFGFLLNRLSLKGSALFFSLLIFGLPWSNIGTMVWTVQWSQVLSMTFLFLAAHVLLSIQEDGICSVKNGGLFFVSCLAGTLCFSKGVIVCASLIVWCLFMISLTWKRPWHGWIAMSLAGLPMILVAGLIIAYSSGNHHSLMGSGMAEYLKAIEFAACYFFLNPLFHLFRLFVPFQDSTPYLLALAPVKIAIFLSGLLWSYRTNRVALFQFLLFLIVFDLANTAVLGIGRYHEGNYSAVVKRYQYTSLISFAPFAGIFLVSLIEKVTSLQSMITPRVANSLCSIVVSLFLAFGIGSPWWMEIKETSRWSGKQGRRLIFHNRLRPDRPKEHGAWIGIPPILSLEEVRRVVKKYNLH